MSFAEGGAGCAWLGQDGQVHIFTPQTGLQVSKGWAKVYSVNLNSTGTKVVVGASGSLTVIDVATMEAEASTAVYGHPNPVVINKVGNFVAACSGKDGSQIYFEWWTGGHAERISGGEISAWLVPMAVSGASNLVMAESAAGMIIVVSAEPGAMRSAVGSCDSMPTAGELIETERGVVAAVGDRLGHVQLFTVEGLDESGSHHP